MNVDKDLPLKEDNTKCDVRQQFVDGVINYITYYDYFDLDGSWSWETPAKHPRGAFIHWLKSFLRRFLPSNFKNGEK